MAAHRGLAAIQEEAASGVTTPAENMAILKALVRDTLAEAERARAAAGGRTEADIAGAIARHRRAREEMRCALRHNDVSTVYPKVAQAAEAEALRLDPEDARLPMLCREAAQALIAVADETIAREDGVHAECGRCFAGLIAEAGAPGPWMSDGTMPGAAACAPPPEAALATPPVPGPSPDPSPDPGPMASVSAPSRSAHGADPAERTAPRDADTAPAKGPGSAGVPAAPARDAGARDTDAQGDPSALPIDAAFQLMLDDKLANDADGASLPASRCARLYRRPGFPRRSRASGQRRSPQPSGCDSHRDGPGPSAPSEPGTRPGPGAFRVSSCP